MSINSLSPLSQPILERAARVIRVVAHPLRLRILEALEGGELNVADLQAQANASQAVVSQHLATLRAHGVVDARREGPRVYYRIIEPKVSRILDCIRECDLPDLPELPALAEDDELGDGRKPAATAEPRRQRNEPARSS